MVEPPRSALEAHLAAVVEKARERLGSRADALEEAAGALEEHGDARATVLRLAHKLRGLGGSIGRPDLSERAGRLEDAIRAGASSHSVAEGALRLAKACRRPDAPSGASAAPSSAAASPSMPRARRQLGWRVLVIDDAPATCQLLALTLRAAGCEVEATDDPEVFLAHARDRRPDLVIVDAMMPGTSGLTLHGEIRALAGPSLPVVILSAASVSDLGWVLPNDPALRWMRKPFRGGPLLDALSAFVDEATR